MTLTAVAVEALTVTKGRRAVVDGVTTYFAQGALHAVVGPNGAGKSTLLRAVAGLETVTAGSIRLGRDDLAALSPVERARRIAWVPDATRVPFAYTALETTLMGRFAWHQGLPRETDRRRAERALADVGALGHRDTPLTALSSGERERVLVARALASDAPVLLLDEPTANLDVAAALHLLGTLRRRAAAGATVVVTLHDLALAGRFADACTCLAQGRVLASGLPAAALAPGVLRQAFGVDVRIARTERGEAIPYFDV